MRFAAVLFDFDGVILDSELASNRVLAEQLTALGYPTTLEESLDRYMGRHWADNERAITEQWGPLPDGFREAQLDGFSGEDAVAGVAEFVASLRVPRAVASSSPSAYLHANLERLGLAAAFGGQVFSAAEHVTRGKPHPDIYLHAAAALGVDPAAALVIEDTPIGVRAGLAAGATVVGLTAGSHCRPGHAELLRAAGAHHVARDYAGVAAFAT
jgi:HAD superfamily hydrolase (TIGR01509 family)